MKGCFVVPGVYRTIRLGGVYRRCYVRMVTEGDRGEPCVATIALEAPQDGPPTVLTEVPYWRLCAESMAGRS